MLINTGLLLLGLLALFFGGEWLVRGAARIAVLLGIPKVVVGLTIVSFGTSAPELFVSADAAIKGSTGLALGNVIGSNIANLGLILGLTAIIRPLDVQSGLRKREIPFLIILTAVLMGIMYFTPVTLGVGILFTVGYLAFGYWIHRVGQKTDVDDEDDDDSGSSSLPYNPWKETGRLIAGTAVLLVGAELTVDAGVFIAREFGVSDIVIGLSLLAFGTSLPELVTSVVATYRNHSDIAVGNVVGSNIANLLAVLGITAMFETIPVPASVWNFEYPVLIGLTVLLFPLVWDGKFGRIRGAFFFGAYLAFIIAQFVIR